MLSVKEAHVSSGLIAYPNVPAISIKQASKPASSTSSLYASLTDFPSEI